MQIANPIYDVVFKYLMEDNKVARIFLSALLGKEIVELQFQPQELSTDFGQEEQSSRIEFTTGLTFYRLDFAARIRTETGEEQQIIIELQKAKLTNDMIRFRSYLGKQYMNADLFRWIVSRQGRRYKAGIPIYAIFILGESLQEYAEVPVVKLETAVRDYHTGELLGSKGDFVPSLFHEGLIINVPALSHRRRNELETLLSIFDQEQIDESHHVMTVREEDFPERYRPVIRRLQAAVQSKEMRNKMQIEDDFLRELNDYEFRIETAEKRAEEERRLRQAAEQKAEQERKEKEAAEQKALQLQAVLVRLLHGQGQDLAEISRQTGLSVAEIERILAE
ncbi:hypothetical protein [Rhodoflexus caldus]|uniref:hypothetical protein n=1 Tax=Rhodoflexus caldus TaxID=2891236 RepID=UPI00202A35FA|nr:hypothetical protein [Rhodoflexus caldus]